MYVSVVDLYISRDPSSDFSENVTTLQKRSVDLLAPGERWII